MANRSKARDILGRAAKIVRVDLLIIGAGIADEYVVATAKGHGGSDGMIEEGSLEEATVFSVAAVSLKHWFMLYGYTGG